MLLVVCEGRVERVGKLANDGDGPVVSGQVGLLAAVDDLLEDEERNDQREDRGGRRLTACVRPNKTEPLIAVARSPVSADPNRVRGFTVASDETHGAMQNERDHAVEPDVEPTSVARQTTTTQTTIDAVIATRHESCVGVGVCTETV